MPVKLGCYQIILIKQNPKIIKLVILILFTEIIVLLTTKTLSFQILILIYKASRKINLKLLLTDQKIFCLIWNKVKIIKLYLFPRELIVKIKIMMISYLIMKKALILVNTTIRFYKKFQKTLKANNCKTLLIKIKLSTLDFLKTRVNKAKD